MKIAETRKNICDTHIIPDRCKEVFLPLRNEHAAVLRKNGLILSGISRLVKGFQIGRVNPAFNLIISTIHGQGQLTTKDKIRTLTAGDLLIAPSNMPHLYKVKKNRWEFIWFHLMDNFMWSYLKQGGIKIRKHEFAEELKHAMQSLISETYHTGRDSQKAVSHFSEIILIYLKRELNLNTEIHNHVIKNRLSGIWDRVNADLSRKWDANTLAGASGYSSAHFTRICKSIYNRTPINMVTNIRMTHAGELLSSGDYTVGETAQLVGYNDTFAFSTAFKRFCGKTPSEYRKQFIHF
jgi:AraC-like DNA-binding protein